MDTSETPARGWSVPPIWRGERVFIVAGGPSVATAPVTKIRGRIIAVKHAALLLPTADVLFWAGRSWHKEFQAVLERHVGPYKIKRTIDDDVPHGILQIDRAQNPVALSNDPQFLGGYCAGGSALNLAFLLGASEIVLVGFDFGGRHWFSNHPRPVERDAAHVRHMLAIEAMAPTLKGLHVDVFNCSVVSRLDCFPKRNLDEFL